MSLRRNATISGAAGAFALALMMATPAAASASAGELPGDGPLISAAPQFPPPGPGMPSAPAMPGGPDMRPMWHGAAMDAPGMPDQRSRDAWMRECHRRTEYYYGGRGKRHHRRDDRRESGRGYSYCEAYFDDYYRTYVQPAYAHAYVRPMAMVQPSQPCIETVTTEYVPTRTRYIPRRPARRMVPDKRIRVTPDKRLPMN